MTPNLRAAGDAMRAAVESMILGHKFSEPDGIRLVVGLERAAEAWDAALQDPPPEPASGGVHPVLLDAAGEVLARWPLVDEERDWFHMSIEDLRNAWTAAADAPRPPAAGPRDHFCVDCDSLIPAADWPRHVSDHAATASEAKRLGLEPPAAAREPALCGAVRHSDAHARYPCTLDPHGDEGAHQDDEGDGWRDAHPARRAKPPPAHAAAQAEARTYTIRELVLSRVLTGARMPYVGDLADLHATVDQLIHVLDELFPIPAQAQASSGKENP